MAVAVLVVLLIVYARIAYVTNYGHNLSEFALFVVLWVGLSAFFSFRLTKDFNKRRAARAEKEYYDGVQEGLSPRRFSFGEEGLLIETTTPGRYTAWRAAWASVRRVEQVGAALCPVLADGDIMMLPKRVLGQEEARFLALLAERRIPLMPPRGQAGEERPPIDEDEEEPTGAPLPVDVPPPVAGDGALMTLDFTCGKDEVAAWFAFLAGRQNPAPNARHASFVGGMLSLLALVLFSLGGWNVYTQASYAAGVIMLLGLAVLCILFFRGCTAKGYRNTFRKRAARLYARGGYPLWYRPRRYILYEDVLVSETFGPGACTRREIALPAIEAVHEADRMIYLQLSTALYLPLPARAFENEEGKARFLGHVGARRQAKLSAGAPALPGTGEG